MENPSTMSKRRSLTLSSRLLQKRHSASPQNRVRASAAQDVNRNEDETGTQDSPTVTRKVNTDSVESTPPNKKMHSLDDSLDFSPLNNNLSPSCLFSQTLVTGSPEVSWRWNSDRNGRGDKVNTTSDSGFDSEEFGTGAFKQMDRRKQVRVEQAAVEQRRKQLENKQWRAQQIRDHKLLKERCDKLHRQLEQPGDQQLEQQLEIQLEHALDQPLEKPLAQPWQPMPCKQLKTATPPAALPPAAIPPAALPRAAPPPAAAPPAATTTAPQLIADDPALADFLNDSDTDCFLLEATQQLESDLAPKPAVATTPTSHHKSQQAKEKRSSFYMKFLEDESETEDWFVALDEAMLEATQPKKPRISLQRYKSMPSNTGATTAQTASTNSIIVSSSLSAKPTGSASSSSTVTRLGSNAGKVDATGFKRHASSHALAPATLNARNNLSGRRK